MIETSRRPISLLEELRAGLGFEAGLLTSFNSYLPFVEEVVLPRLRAAGCHYLVVMIDRTQLAGELAEQARRPLAAGRRYALLPVGCGGAFHPKLLLLVGPRKARLIVGSHNLTMSGFIQNRELTNVIEIGESRDQEGAAALIESVEFCKAWASGLPPALLGVVEDFSKFCSSYLGPVPEKSAVTVVGSRPNGPDLWQRVRKLLPEAAQRIVVLGPFFDQELAFLRRLQEDFRPQSLVVGLDPRSAKFPGKTKLFPGDFRIVDAQDLDPGHKGRGYLHGKAILIESKVEKILITGSANPTERAWLAPAGSRNAEIVVVRKLSTTQFDDLGLVQLFDQSPIEPLLLAQLHARPEPRGNVSSVGEPLVGICQGSDIHIDGVFRSVDTVSVRNFRGVELSSKVRKSASGLIIEIGEHAYEASSIAATLDGLLCHGFVHHPDLLREAVLSSSQRRVRDALGGLGGNVSQLENLYRLVEKLIFEGPKVASGTDRERRESTGSKGDQEGASTVALVDTLKEGQVHEKRHIAEGDLGLLLDYLMRKLWQSLSHETSSGSRSEVELLDSEDEDLADQLLSDRAIAEKWLRKSRTLLKRLRRRIEESSEGEALQVVIESAAVLGLLEALRRVEDQDRWRSLRAELVDREAAEEFIFAATPPLLDAGTGLLDNSTAQAGATFAEQQGLIEWLTWLSWLSGFGPSELSFAEDPDDPDAGGKAADRLACVCLIGGRVAQCDPNRILELLEATPFPGTDARFWLDALVCLGMMFSNPAAARRLERPPRSGDLVLTQNGAGPFVVRSIRMDKADLIDYSRKKGSVPFRVNSLQVLDRGEDLG
ncbi:MAG: hypothetical protein ACJ76Y_22530 [Thermoanaerobaculia bacterium]